MLIFKCRHFINSFNQYPLTMLDALNSVKHPIPFLRFWAKVRFIEKPLMVLVVSLGLSENKTKTFLLTAIPMFTNKQSGLSWQDIPSMGSPEWAGFPLPDGTYSVIFRWCEVREAMSEHMLFSHVALGQCLFTVGFFLSFVKEPSLYENGRFVKFRRVILIHRGRQCFLI